MSIVNQLRLIVVLVNIMQLDGLIFVIEKLVFYLLELLISHVKTIKNDLEAI